jgi:hypothetical protein
MGVKKSARGKARPKRVPKPAAATVSDEVSAPEPEAPVEPAAIASPSRARFTRNIAVGAGLLVIAVVAGVAMFWGHDAGQRAEVATDAAQPDSAAVAAVPSKPVRALPGKKSTPKPRPTAAAPAPKTASELPDASLIEGCLEQTGQTFRLKDTSGEGAPKSRSWKSGFLKKNSRPVEVVDWNNRLKDHVGERISVSGMFVDGEMHVRSLRRVSTTCN